VEAIVLTHAHQDHIGALRTLFACEAGAALRDCPIYATPYTAATVEHAFTETRLRPRLHSVALDTPVPVGPFSVRWFPVTHSAPETAMIVVET
ncbi:MBL fold metallo-hydrolase, partial [Aeromonas veronii]|uniref:MBL fold metallo-hydrolase n=1 Tax=Aeromonas veronii TaxID=654 RepID=UPI00214E42CA